MRLFIIFICPRGTGLIFKSSQDGHSSRIVVANYFLRKGVRLSDFILVQQYVDSAVIRKQSEISVQCNDGAAFPCIFRCKDQQVRR